MAYDWDKGACKAPPKVGDRVHMKVPSEKQSSRNPKLANSWEGPYRVIESSDNSALLTFTQDNREPVSEPFDLLVKLTPQISDGPLRTTKTCGKEGGMQRINKNERTVATAKISYFRTFFSIDHPLNLRRNCGCGLFDHMAHVALPSLSHPMARSKEQLTCSSLLTSASISEKVLR